jgi:hypothetical protein
MRPVPFDRFTFGTYRCAFRRFGSRVRGSPNGFRQGQVLLQRLHGFGPEASDPVVPGRPDLLLELLDIVFMILDLRLHEGTVELSSAKPLQAGHGFIALSADVVRNIRSDTVDQGGKPALHIDVVVHHQASKGLHLRAFRLLFRHQTGLDLGLVVLGRIVQKPLVIGRDGL